MKNLITIIVLLNSLTGCAWFGYSGNSNNYSGKTSIPKIPIIQIPGGNDYSWRYLGTTDNNMVIIEINDNSISSYEPLIYNFQDRKTIIDINKFAYLNNQPHYKYLISNWQINCGTKPSYLIVNATMYNESGNKIAHYDYIHDDTVRWMLIGTGSIAELQSNYICLNKNRELGY